MTMKTNLNRREFIRASAAAAAGVGLAQQVFGGAPGEATCKTVAKLVAKADSVIHIWLPGGIAQTDTWDPKKFTPFRAGMKGNELLGTCESIPTAADGIRLGAGLDTIASVMDHGAILRSLTNEVKFGAIHLKVQYYLM